MASSTSSFTEHAGFVLFPRNPHDLLHTSQCPACFTELPSNLVCARCRLDLNHPDAAQLHALSLEASAALEARLELIGKIRFETAQATQSLGHNTQSASAPTAPPLAAAPLSAPNTTMASRPATTVVSPEQHATEPLPADGGLDGFTPSDEFGDSQKFGDADKIDTPNSPRSHSGIQVILLVVGVSLLSVGAIFFLIYAFLNFGLLWRSAIIATITIASIVAANVVNKRGLRATAEALSALGIVFALLDIFALRANDLLVVGDDSGLSYWGGALLIVSLGLIAWHRNSNLTLVSIVGFLLLPIAAALLTLGAAIDHEFAPAAMATLTVVAVASLAHVAATHGNYSGIVERIVLLTTAGIALVLGLLTFIGHHFFPSDTELTGWLVALAIAAALHSTAAHRSRLPTAIVNSFAAIAGVLTAASVWKFLSVTLSTGEYSLTTEGSIAPASLATPPVVVAIVIPALTLLALAAEASTRNLSPAIRGAFTWGSLGLWSVVIVATLTPLAQSIAVALQHVMDYADRHITSGNTPYELINSGFPQWSLVSIPIVMTLVWWGSRQLVRRTHLVLGSAGIAFALSAPLAQTLANAVLVWLTLAILAFIVIAVHRSRRGPHSTQITIASAGLLALTLAYLTGWSSYDTALFTSVTTGIVLVAARNLVSSALAKAALVGTAAIIFLLTAANIGEQLQFTMNTDAPNPLESWLAVSILAVAFLLASLGSTLRILTTLERRVLWWVGLTSSIIAAATLWNASVNLTAAAHPPLTFDLAVTSLAVAALLVAGLGITMLSKREAQHKLERLLAAVLLAPATLWALDSAARALGLGDIAIELAPATASVLVGALSMTLRVRQAHTPLRRASELSALAIAAITTTAAIAQPTESHWLIVALVSVTLLVASIAPDGIIGSQSRRRHAIWASLAFATAALWLRLDQAQVEALEAYVLPLAAIILTIAALTARVELRNGQLTSAPYITLAGLMIALIPLSLNAATGSGLQTLIIAGVCGTLLLSASFVPPAKRLISFWGVALIASATGLVLATSSRTLTLISDTANTLPELDFWLLGGVAVLALASFGLASSGFHTETKETPWAVASEASLGVAIVLLYATETLIVLSTSHSTAVLNDIRIVSLIVLGGVLLVLSLRDAGVPSTNPPLSRRLSYLAFTLASVLALIALIATLVRPLEWITVTLGVALLLYGGLKLARHAEARSLPWVAPGLLVTLLPSLIVTFTDTTSADTQWRIVAVGIASVIAMVVGVWRKLQAPLLVGTIVVLVHAAHTFAPAIVAFYQLTDWWVWAVVGGAIVLFLGITLERRIRDLKALNTRFSALR